MTHLLPKWATLWLVLLFSGFTVTTIAQNNAALQKVIAGLTAQKQWDNADLNSIAISRAYIDPTTGIEHIYAVQQIDGLDIIGTNYSLHSRAEKQIESGSVLQLSKEKISGQSTAIDVISAVKALMSAVNYDLITEPLQIKQPAQGATSYSIVKRNNDALWDIPCRLVYYNDKRKASLTKAWEVLMMDKFRQHYWAGYVDAATGNVLEKRDLILRCSMGPHGATDLNIDAAAQVPRLPVTNNGSFQSNTFNGTGTTGANNSYKVIDMPYESIIDPGATHATVVNTGNNIASIDGWHRVANAAGLPASIGNNVYAFQDPSPTPLGGIPSPDPTHTAYANNGVAGAPPATEPYDFDYSFNPSADPTTYTNAAIVNLFYWNNLMHDVFYQFGFNEDAGNFQASNTFSTGTKGGPGALGGDLVLAQAQDGGGTNNANFLASVPDGVSGQMQMYLWTASTPDSMVQITSSTTGAPAAGTKFYAVQGSFNTTIGNNDLYANPVVNKQIVLVQKNALSTVGASSEGCSTGQQSIALPPGNNVLGKIVLIDRGTCSFVEKVLGAQFGGAAGVIVINNVAGDPPIAMGGSDAPGNAINVPSVMVTKETGDLLKAQLAAGATLMGSLQRTAPAAAKRDGDFDNGVISHEYGHGISNRLTGGPNDLGGLSGAEQGGEGWSDYMALYMTLRTNDLDAPTVAHPNGVLPNRSIGNYVTYQAYNGQGIREYPYSSDLSINPATLAYVKRPDYSETHSVGFVWCSMLYEVLQTMVDKYGMGNDPYEAANPAGNNPAPAAKGNNVAMRLIFEGMKLQPTDPTFIQQRDAILKADTLLYGAQDACLLWKAFAKRGLGLSASSATNALGDEVEAFDVPLSCDPTQHRVRVEKSAPGATLNGNTIIYTIKVTNRYGVPVTGVTLADTLAATLSFVSATNSPVVNGKKILWTFDLAANEVKLFTVQATLGSPSSSTALFSDDQETSASKWTTSTDIPSSSWTYTTDAANAYSGSRFWFAPDADTPGSNMMLATATSVAVTAGTQLVFIHKYATESGFDGGVVEVSTNGTSWTYLPPTKFSSNGYTTLIPTTNNPLIGTTDLSAFSGSSAGYITSIADLNDYVGMNVFIRFRMTSDPTGGSITGGGWWIDNVYILKNPVSVTNSATAVTISGQSILPYEGTNAVSAVNTFVIGTAALATGLGNLTGVVSNSNIASLKWTATNDMLAGQYIIERQQIGVDNNLNSLSNVPAIRSAGPQEYTTNDNSLVPNARYYYRIKQISLTGNVLYTNTIILQTTGKAADMTVYPNPAKDLVQVSLTNPANEKGIIILYDGSGKKMSSFNIAPAASSTISLPVSGLANGVYWIEYRSGERTITQNMVIRH